MGLSPSQAKILLDRNALNYAEKVKSGKPLSPSEIAMLESIADGVQAGEISGKRFAENQVELAEMLGVERKTIQRWLKRKDAPGKQSNGSFDVLTWREYARRVGRKDSYGEDDLDAQQARAKNILLQNEKLEFQIGILKRQYVATADVEQWTGDMIAQAKKVLLSGPAALAPQVVGVMIPEAERLLRDWLHEAMSQLAVKPLGEKEAHEAVE